MNKAVIVKLGIVILSSVLGGCTSHPSATVNPSTYSTEKGVMYYDVFFEIDPSDKTFLSEQHVYMTSNLAEKNNLYVFIGEDLIIDRLSLEYESGEELPIVEWRKVDTDIIEYWWGQSVYSEIKIEVVEEIKGDELLILNLDYHLPEEAIEDGIPDNFYNLFISSSGSHAGGPESGAFPMVSGNLSAPFTMTLEHPITFQCAGPGERVAQVDRGRFATVTYQSNMPYDPSFSCAPYTVIRQMSKDMQIDFFIPAHLDLSSGMIETGAQIPGLYQDLFGKPLADSFRIVFPHLDSENGGGECNGNIIFLGDIQPFLYYDEDEKARDIFAHLIAHEGYHLWNAWSLNWEGELAEWWVEGGANFMASWSKEMLFGDASGAKNRQRHLEGFIEQEAYLHKNSLANLDDTWFADWALVYDYGALVWEQLRQKIGSDAMLAGLREFYQSYAGKTTNYHDFISCMEKHTDVDVGAALDPWVQHNARIDLILHDVHIRPSNDSYTIEVDIEVDADRDYELFTTLGYKTENLGDWHLIDLHLMERGQHQVKFVSSERPLEVQLDPEYRVPQINLDNNDWMEE
jgi:hypothetical protein